MRAGYLAAVLIGIPLTINLCSISCLVGLWDTFAKCLHFLPILKLELSDACLACVSPPGILGMSPVSGVVFQASASAVAFSL